MLNLSWPYKIPTSPRPKNWPRNTTARRWRPHRRQRRHAQGRATARRLRPAEGRRQHRLRLLDLRRQLDRAGNQMARRDNSDPYGMHQTRTGPGPGRPTAASSTTAPRRPAGKPWDPRKTPGVVERQGLGRHRRARLQGRLAAGSGDEPVHHEPRGRGAVLRRRQDGRGPFPEHYEPFETPIGINPLHPQNKKATSNPAGGSSIRCGHLRHPRRVPLRGHHLPADRALPLLDQALPAQRHRPARAVRRNRRGAGQREGIKAGDRVRVSSKRGTSRRWRW
jgi:formate dehydrogenase major subunit